MRWRVKYLPVREAERGKAVNEVGVVPLAVDCLLRPCAVEAAAVGFDDDAQVGPVEVDLVAVDPGLAEWWWKSGCFDGPPELPFEGSGGGCERLLLEESSQRRRSRAPAGLFNSIK